MIPILAVLVLCVVLILWCIEMAACRHLSMRGLANYYDDDLQAFVHLKQCDDCADTFITIER